jgi:argininosuccinate lyase
LGYALTRLALRPALLELIQALLTYRKSLTDFATEHLDTLMPGYTHGQPAQPTTMAHYVAGIASTLIRDTQRFMSIYQVNNASPLGAAAFTGTGFPIDRGLVAYLLGFSSVIESTYDAIAASDNLTDTAFGLTSLGINLSRFLKDLLFWATKESGAITIHDSFIQISSIMPQKRNPVVLEHLRARISRMLGQAHTIVIQCHNIPFGDTQDIEDEILPSIFAGIQSGLEILELFTAVIETLQVNCDDLAMNAQESFISMTELADTLVRDHGLAFRQAHHIISALVNRLVADENLGSQVPSELLAEVSATILESPVELSQQELDDALNPRSFVHKRTHLGGAAPSATKTILQTQNQHLIADQDWLQVERKRLTTKKAQLQTAIKQI